MQVVNLHERTLLAKADAVGALIDGLGSPHDQLWPVANWPRMTLDRPLALDATGGHGPIRYRVVAYEPGRRLAFRFVAPRGFDGGHSIELIADNSGAVRLMHTLRMTARGSAVLSWPLVFKPLHDALIEDALTRAQSALGLEPQVHSWSLWVRVLRWMLTGGRANAQFNPGAASPDRHR